MAEFTKDENNMMTHIIGKITNHFGDNLISVVAFGSSCREGKFSITSDIDLFIILKQLKCHQDLESRRVKKLLRMEFPLVSFNIYTSEEFEAVCQNNGWLLIGISEGHYAFVDKNRFFEKTVELNLANLKRQRVLDRDWYYAAPKNIKPLVSHYTRAYKEFLSSSETLYKTGQYTVALNLLLESAHFFMISEMLKLGIYINRGEITQCYYKLNQSSQIDPEIYEALFKLEQSVNTKYSFDFKSGEQIFDVADSKKIYQQALKALEAISEKS